ncbi:MAG: iron ABC transporter permease [Myxococcales bacterium]|nr:iron ABC transporter permease [Myxococcales bacterium]
MSKPRVPIWIVLGLALTLSLVLSMFAGHGDLYDSALWSTFLQLRLYRFFASFLAGGALAVGGVLVQGLFRNPLASPSLIGTSAGATLGGAMVLLVFDIYLVKRVPWLPAELLLPLGCLTGALMALVILLTIAGPQPDRTSLLLIGFILSSLFLSLGGLLSSLAQENWELGRAMLVFTLGGVDAKGARHIALALPMIVGGLIYGLAWASHLDVLLTGDDEASTLGVEIYAVRRWIVIWTAVLTAAAVTLGGNVSFVGLIIPNMLRRYLGPIHRPLLLAAFLGGGCFVAFADVLVRLLPTRGQIPLGVVTSLVGAPIFLRLLMMYTAERERI